MSQKHYNPNEDTREKDSNRKNKETCSTQEIGSSIQARWSSMTKEGEWNIVKSFKKTRKAIVKADTSSEDNTIRKKTSTQNTLTKNIFFNL